jgi:hypothetical protein
MWDLEHFALGPMLWKRTERAAAKDSLEQTSWDRGVVSAARQYDDLRSLLPVLQVFAAGGTGLPLGNAVSDLPLIGQVLVGGLGAVVAFWAVPSLWAAIAAIRAPVDQRNEAREALRTQKDESSKAYLRLALQQSRQKGEEASNRIGEFRDHEEEEKRQDFQTQIRSGRRADAQIALGDWANFLQATLFQFGLDQEAVECELSDSDFETGDALQAAWHRINNVVYKVLLDLN